ncbi:hypothetical protein SKAU_G00156120 [Synaphobranchus kaupii]|uniref:C1q domain-containing protein n=1 Tax=Synaphobranchus kaupii TaxID=118154 RepID=A0A9Q1IZF9_SYNKA|nr:hypothetical protein SKAU_G00156120 [Synaphobranchus kaupii]
MQGEPGVPGLRGETGRQGTARSLRGAWSGSARRSAWACSPASRSQPPGLPVRFDKVFYNEEGHYDLKTSKFNCTHGGVYVFTYHITDIDQASNLVLLKLSAGDQVWLETLRDWNGVYSSSEDDSTFSGFLLYAEKD